METKLRCVETKWWRLEDVARGTESVLRGLEIILRMRRLRRSFRRAHADPAVCTAPPLPSSYCRVSTCIIMKNRSVKFIYLETYIPVSPYIFLWGHTSPNPRQVRGWISKQMSVDSCASASVRQLPVTCLHLPVHLIELIISSSFFNILNSFQTIRICNKWSFSFFCLIDLLNIMIQFIEQYRSKR